ncbi:MAG TPA: metallophosphoesterase family protein [Bryobacteraceae bacterium]|nr:metallophosphoesterase family protein [Bryobacteraceae bacterium]
MRIGLLSDTHGFLDDAVFTYFAECDEIWHAGDFGTIDVVRALREFKPVRGVFGNVDGAAIRAEFPCDNEWECEGVRVFMTHIGGHPGRYEPRAKKDLLLRRPDLFLCGHSHILRVDRDPTLNLLHMNPGACGHHGLHAMRTLLRFTIAEGKIKEVEAIELGPRGRKHARNLS